MGLIYKVDILSQMSLMHLMDCEVQANVCLWFVLDGVLASVLFVPFIVHNVFVSSALG